MLGVFTIEDAEIWGVPINKDLMYEYSEEGALFAKALNFFTGDKVDEAKGDLDNKAPKIIKKINAFTNNYYYYINIFIMYHFYYLLWIVSIKNEV